MATAQFQPFPRLPTEIRLIIWRKCLPSRVFEIDSPGPTLKATACHLTQTTKQNGRIPLLSHVCREARSVVLESGGPKGVSGRWFVPLRDTAVMYWTPTYHLDAHGVVGERREFKHFLHQAAAIGIPVERVHPLHPEHDVCGLQWVIQDCQSLESEKNEYLAWVDVVVLHGCADDARRSGLFGTLGDEAIQLVDPADMDILRRLKGLWSSSEPQDPEPKSFFNNLETLPVRAEQWRRYLEKQWVYNMWLVVHAEGGPDVPELDDIMLPSKEYYGDRCELLNILPLMTLPSTYVKISQEHAAPLAEYRSSVCEGNPGSDASIFT